MNCVTSSHSFSGGISSAGEKVWPLAVLFAVTGFALAFGVASKTIAAPCFLLTALILGMPHGAADVLLPFHQWQQFPLVPRVVGFLGIYIVCLGGLVWLARMFPNGFFLTFLGFTAFHWGSGDYTFLRHRRSSWLLCSLSRGLLVVGGILSSGPLETTNLARYFGALAVAEFPWRLLGEILLTTGALANLLGVIRLKDGVKTSAQILETTGLFLLFLFAPIYLAVATYFLLLHSPRHLHRVLDRLPRPFPKTLGKIHLWLIPVSLISLAILWPFLPASVSVVGWEDWTAKYLWLLAIYTIPHALLVAAADLEWLKM